MDVDFFPTKLTRPTGIVTARWLGAIGETGLVHIRYWKPDPISYKMLPVHATAKYCREHCILYLTSDYPRGCPECEGTNPDLKALLFK